MYCFVILTPTFTYFELSPFFGLEGQIAVSMSACSLSPKCVTCFSRYFLLGHPIDTGEEQADMTIVSLAVYENQLSNVYEPGSTDTTTPFVSSMSSLRMIHPKLRHNESV